MCWQVDTPSQCSCADNDTYETIGKVTFHKVPVLTQHASMVDSKAARKQLTKLLVSTVRHLPFHSSRQAQCHKKLGNLFKRKIVYRTVSIFANHSFKAVIYYWHCQWYFQIVTFQKYKFDVHYLVFCIHMCLPNTSITSWKWWSAPQVSCHQFKGEYWVAVTIYRHLSYL